MSTYKRCGLLFAFVAVNAMAQDSPGLGEPIDAATLAEIDYTVMPDGDGLPQGSGSAAAGRDVYLRNCLACHGENGSGGINDVLSGGHGSITGPRPQKTLGSYWPYATTIFDYIRRAMPFAAPGSLSDSEVYALTAYLLHQNGIVTADFTADRVSLPAVEMPNREGFVGIDAAP